MCLCEAGPRTLYSEAHAPTLVSAQASHLSVCGAAPLRSELFSTCKCAPFASRRPLPCLCCCFCFSTVCFTGAAQSRQLSMLCVYVCVCSVFFSPSKCFQDQSLSAVFLLFCCQGTLLCEHCGKNRVLLARYSEGYGTEVIYNR